MYIILFSSFKEFFFEISLLDELSMCIYFLYIHSTFICTIMALELTDQICSKAQ
jgi:hypothetical protein